jgi:hypothetical protein
VEASELQVQVFIGKVPPVLEGTVCFETGATREQLGLTIYEHHGEGFGPEDPGALTRFFEDLVLGSPLPLSFATSEVRGPDTLLAMALFMHRDLLLQPATPGLVAAIDLTHRWGPPLLAHLDPLVARFVRSFDRFFTPTLSERERGERIAMAVQWVREYLLEGNVPNIGFPLPDVRVLDVGTNGFVLAETGHPSVEAWEVLYRMGHLRGVLLGPDEEGARQVVASRKSERAWPHLSRSVEFLNDLELLSGGDPGWVAERDFLRGPAVGSKTLVSHLLEVFLRI